MPRVRSKWGLLHTRKCATNQTRAGKCSPRLRLGHLKSRSGPRFAAKALAVHRPVTVAPGARVSAPLRSRCARLKPLHRALGLRPTVNGETPRRRSNRRPMSPRATKRRSRLHTLRRSFSRTSEDAIGVPAGVIAPESGLTARFPRGMGPSVAQERRFEPRTREKRSADF